MLLTNYPKNIFLFVMNNCDCRFLLTLRSHTTREFRGSHTGLILPSQFQKTIVRKLFFRCGSKNYGTCFEHSRLRTKSQFVRKHMTC